MFEPGFRSERRCKYLSVSILRRWGHGTFPGFVYGILGFAGLVDVIMKVVQDRGYSLGDLGGGRATLSSRIVFDRYTVR